VTDMTALLLAWLEFCILLVALGVILLRRTP